MPTAVLSSSVLPSISLSGSNPKPSATHAKPAKHFKKRLTVIRNSKAEGPSLRRPSAPRIKEATTPPPPPLRSPEPPPPSLRSPEPPSPSPSDASPSPPVSSSAIPDTSQEILPTVTLEFQRQRAKEMQEYFKQKKIDEQYSQSQVFGFIPKNEISNGRWAMFGFAVGLLTEYATGSSFVEQMKILISNVGIADLE
eukprot:TRINITY_DN37784_c0_g1_i1.p1 TRINITY_DN37784_c0_g1~~TRINITY_DN37784_c0_g1_i1.p1  ORF type:complete len:196 (+),score=40.23 TRINITY_DN37784_c0_g1_i1:190-777(+)